MNVVLNNLVFSAKTPKVGDKCLLIQTGNNKYCIPLTNEVITNKSLTNLYKCVSVDATNKKWSGNKAIFINGKYEYETSVTNDLEYGNGYVPEIGKIYDEDALICIEKLFEGN